MPLSLGSRRGPYEILASLGAGGMEEVRKDDPVAQIHFEANWTAEPPAPLGAKR